MPGSLGTHDRQHRACHVEDAEDIRCELLRERGPLDLLECAELPIPGIVDQDIDTAKLPIRFAYRSIYGSWVGYIQSESLQSVAVARQRIFDLPRIAGGGDYRVADIESGARDFHPEATAGPGDKPSFHCFCPVNCSGASCTTALFLAL
ncbi:hypothetical protein [Neorhizobium sp. P12A]|uniref:hypothetical protein n=1 Tax=Neorhizobium sp. P12A TaxID=2268027 RepID=UPI001FEFB508|nr:hypothetical protein [Neorhizobium sp. P12A]